MKKFISLILALVMVFTTFSVAGSAVEEPFASGYVYNYQNEELYWELSEDGGTLTITGNGYMGEFEETPQWLSYNFTKLVVGEGLKDVGIEAFLNAKSLESVELSSDVELIGQRAFYGCENLKEIKFNNVSSVGSMAFYGCMSYTDIEIPATVTEIDEYAFGYYCNEELDDEFAKIENVIISAKADTAAQKYAEENGIEFINLSDYSKYFTYGFIGDTKISLQTYTDCPYSDEIIIPEEIDGYKVAELDAFLFEGSNVKSVCIPSSVEHIYNSAFYNASKLEEIICEKGGNYSSLDGVLYENNGEKLIKVPEAKTEIAEYTENLKIVDGDSFRKSKIKEIEIPYGVESLAGSVFMLAETEKITLPETITEIPGMCFYGAQNLKEVIIPESVKIIGANAFSNCTSLTEIALPYGLEQIDGAAFHCTGLKSIIIPDTVDLISNYAFGYYSEDDIEFVKDEEFEVIGGEAAKKYATENGFRFTDISPEQPVIWYAYTDKVSVTLFWEQTDDAEFYEIYRKAFGTEFEKIAKISLEEDPVYSDLAVENGETYTYCVVAIKNTIRSSFENTVDVEFVSLDTPELVSAEMTRKGIYVKWKSVSDAEGYILYRRTENSEWEEIADFKGSVKTYEDTTTKSGETYFYTVKAYNGAVESGCDYDGVSAMYLSIPEVKSAYNVTKGIKVTWKKVSGAKGYIIGRKTSSTGWTKIAEVKNVSEYIDTKAKAGTTYTYTVVPVCDDVKGFYNEDGVTYRRISKVITESATNTADGVKIEWDTVSKCTGYKVYRKTQNGSYKRIATVKGASKSYYTDKKAKSGTKYTYKVVAYSDSYVSYYTEVSRYYLDNPELLSAKSGKKGVTAKWETVKGASGYYVYRKEEGKSYKKIATVKGQTKYSYRDTSAIKGKTYTYKVKAYYSKTTSAYSNTKSVKDKY